MSHQSVTGHEIFRGDSTFCRQLFFCSSPVVCLLQNFSPFFSFEVKKGSGRHFLSAIFPQESGHFVPILIRWCCCFFNIFSSDPTFFPPSFFKLKRSHSWLATINQLGWLQPSLKSFVVFFLSPRWLLPHCVRLFLWLLLNTFSQGNWSFSFPFAF